MENNRKSRPSLSLEAQESHMISLAVDLAEQQLRDGTASAQVIAHYLKLGSTRNKKEQEILQKQSELMTAKTEALQSAKRVEDLFEDAMNAFRTYSGSADEDF